MESQLRDDRFTESIEDSDLDLTKIPAGLWMVGDHGIYLMSNISIAAVKSKLDFHVVYADQCNPETMDADDVWEAKTKIFGGDDGSDFLPADAVDRALSTGSNALKIDLTPNSMKLIW